jgi:pimeloyl-ACP methyl ester carboxylesterase
MNTDNFSGDRRRFLQATGAVAATMAAAQFGMTDRASAQTTNTKQAELGAEDAATQSSFGPLKQTRAGVLNVGYVETGPKDGQPVILMHGWPYDIHSYVEVAPILASAGYRTIAPYFRGHGTTRFLSSRTPRKAAQSAFALDTIALMDALKVDQPILAGYDWGSRTADIIAALWPNRCKALVSTTGYLITNQVANKQPLPPKAEWAWWYQYYFATERGKLGLEEYRHDLAELIWKFNSPTWQFDDATFDQTAAAFNNPDYVSIVIDDYRWRQDLAPTQPRYQALERKLATAPTIAVPTITLDGKFDPFTPPGDGASYRKHFTGKYDHRTLPVGHNVPQEDPRGFAQAVVDVDAGHF